MFSTLWAIVVTVLIGFFVGLIARALHPGNDKLSLFWTAVLGVGGSFLAKYAADMLGFNQMGGFMGFIASTIGAIVLLAGYSFYKRSQAKK